ncbi:hypothetical protein COL26b_003354 [Colletotrichum chrysophilum]|uniref:uncharacterized protein n=1 Tax=Colletotrichum chrysophilum TaxID=1836956 RepID=UPI0022FFFF89|nr:uncharacterized protein COL26b_003354 [Colletotrichum chrysophilum]KAJ0378469.1 hypothetical protein COL26b_003354 [Colletotrichum chrysophilum]
MATAEDYGENLCQLPEPTRFPSIKMGQKSGTNTTGKEAGEAKDAPIDGKPGNATSGNGTSSDKSGNSDGKGEGEEDDEFHDTHDTVVTANDPPRRRAPRKKPGVASALETADDDKYDDAWLRVRRRPRQREGR